ncbi:MAG: hypothetical protein CMJ27_05820 [Phycisphaerae bacterium]|nr:hypothetical protein [Phycisphaerae bacterium]MAH65891.1 hypothetical protein [Phycisphaerae bacterium]OUX01837.1 MAG: hypothetical protein CBD91_03630 [Phycisphaeraceae bacterium TMED231]OUX03040.1 MAG: hypothetical protein CBD91_01085 [Phycisphaeraceae bacterium TMED231]
MTSPLSILAQASAFKIGGFDEPEGVLESLLAIFFSRDYSVEFAVEKPTTTELLNGFLPVFLVAFMVTLFTVPIVRWLAIKFDIVDRPDGDRKVHTYPIAYLGGAAVFAGIAAAIVASYLLGSGGYDIVIAYAFVPPAITLGMFAIFMTGMFDDILHWDPRLKIAGQLIAAAALTLSDIGTEATRGLISPILGQWFSSMSQTFLVGVGPAVREAAVWNWVDLGGEGVGEYWNFLPWLTVDGVYYWVGIIFITALVLGACNAANLIDGLDGLLSGSVGIMAIGFVAVSIMLMIVDHRESVAAADTAIEMSAFEEMRARDGQAEKQVIWERMLPDEDPPFVLSSPDLDGNGVWDENDSSLMDDYLEYRATPQVDWLAGPRLVLSLAILGACLGFLPFNFNPAVIFLGDAGSLLLGYLCAVIILSLGSEGQTHYVIAGLIIFALPIMDTVLAILRRKLAGLPMSVPDRNHIHHILLRSFKSVKKAVVVLYLIDLVFVLIGVGLAAAVAFGFARYLLVYGVAIVFFGLVGATATKAALRHRWMMQASEEGGGTSSEDSTVETVEKPDADPA